MSAAYWRKAMNFSPAKRGQDRFSRSTTRPEGKRVLTPSQNPVRARHVVVLAFLLAFPWFATPFFTFQIGAQSLALGLIALSLTFLGGFGGMISLAQMTIAGIVGYCLAIFGPVGASDAGVSLGWPWWMALIMGLLIATAAAAFTGFAHVRDRAFRLW